MDAVCKGERTPMKEYVVEAVAENLTKSVFMATKKTDSHCSQRGSSAN